MAVIDSIQLAKDQSAAIEANELLQLKNSMQQTLELAKRIQAKMSHNFSDANPNAIDWSGIHTLWGVPEGKEQTIWDMVNGSVGAMTGTMQTSDCVRLVERLG